MPMPLPAGIGRNDPCPCGSGRKYKACCGLAQPEAAGAAPAFATAGSLRPDHLTQAGTLTAAASPLQQVIRLRPGSPPPGTPPPSPIAMRKEAAALRARATPLLKAGKYAEAIPLLHRAARLRPDDHDTLHDLGLALTRCQRFAEAIGALRRAAALRPKHAPTHFALGQALELQGSALTALASYERAVALTPRMAEAQARIGELLLTFSREGEAIEALQRAASAAGDTTFGRLCRARSLWALNRADDAGSTLRRTIALDPKNGEAHLMLGQILLEAGRFDEALTELDRAASLSPAEATVWHGLALAKKFTEADRPLLERILARLAMPGLLERGHMMLHFALGKVFDDLKDYAAAMHHFDAANQIRVRQYGRLDRNLFVRPVDQLIERFTPDFLAQHAALANGDEAPVLIIGMPRSGTTLTEQIISNHPRVVGAGEVIYWTQKAPQLLASFEPDQFDAAAKELADGYRELLHGIGPDAARVTDKVPFNFYWVGLVHLLLPNARFIHCRRHPIDTCLSIHTRFFQESWDFVSDRGDLVFYYRQYQRLMEHWRALLPADRLFEVDYEELTADPEPVTRRLIDFCGLEWSDACLRPEQNERVVRTASVWQARQPVYRSSVERWRNYEPWIGELKELLPQQA